MQRSKAVTNLFPMPLTPSRRLIENLLNNKTDESNESINFCDASTSSTLAFSGLNHQLLSSPVPSSSLNVGNTSDLGKIVNLLAEVQMFASELERRMAVNSDPKLLSSQIMEWVLRFIEHCSQFLPFVNQWKFPFSEVCMQFQKNFWRKLQPKNLYLPKITWNCHRWPKIVMKVEWLLHRPANKLRQSTMSNR